MRMLTNGFSRKIGRKAKSLVAVIAIYAVSFYLDAGPGWLFTEPQRDHTGATPLIDRRKVRTVMIAAPYRTATLP